MSPEPSSVLFLSCYALCFTLIKLKVKEERKQKTTHTQFPSPSINAFLGFGFRVNKTHR